MASSETPSFIQLLNPHESTDALRESLLACWVEVSNAGGAAGFPFPPVDVSEVAAVLDGIIAGLGPQSSRLLVVAVDGAVAGWLSIRRDLGPLVSHWGTLHHVQTRLGVRGQGMGAALMRRAREIAREEMGLEQLHLAVRGGVGLEEFYGRLGWQEIGRWPGALRFAPEDRRDEVLMLLSPL
ncbi:MULTISPECIES: GNAT family N-acetyltransferase [unclassified Streptomyces]|uniref:GNAT family N-acetyltransferase n=1 Tax=unclassified Streptomyces TaxID=2593676 RepID=UPI002DDBE114|nr:MULTISPECIES: GNAT family N-acetyltransferase [unclassified Streptomyces]WSA91609.1 GNAT family N-acetyltransferase [Streptomyces sp. NBC_01795]WSB75979.1 GNAT family N-acetyltransferase [Streptomyces sp. NBC_01775]WSS15746.1 GNAT family N-acetyltransferase [Streptomyces sp. NBC_01186]WSS44584.1 GNAT family N-acetyltransferase [Streptomyces sp. NBC_01187]